VAKKEARDAALKRGLDRLREAGVDITSAPAATIDSLTSRIGQDAETDLAIAFLLGRCAESAAVDTLLNIEKTAASKDLKREARRSLFKLEQKGLSVHRTEEAAPAKGSAILGGSDIEGYLCAMDGAGDRLVWLVRPNPGGGLQLIQAAVSDRTGLLRAGGTVMKRKELRAQAEEIKKERGIAVAAVPWEYADKVVYEAYEKSKASGQKTGQFSSMRAAFNPMKPKETPHPIYAKLTKSEAQSEDWRGRSRRLLDEPEFHFWILDEDWMSPYMSQVAAAQESRLVLNDAQKEERIASIVRDAARNIFSGESGGIFARRLEDMALCLLAGDRKDAARLCLAVALQLAAGEMGLLDISFLTGLVQKSLAFYLAQVKQKAEQEPSLIVKP
jgi:hypothetical protein